MPASTPIRKRLSGSLGMYEVTGPVHELPLRDGSVHRLHEVAVRGAPDKFLRAIEMPGGGVRVFDLRRIAPTLGADLPPAPERDRGYIVQYTLRQCFHAGAALAAAVHAVYVASGVPAPLAALEASAA